MTEEIKQNLICSKCGKPFDPKDKGSADMWTEDVLCLACENENWKVESRPSNRIFEIDNQEPLKPPKPPEFLR